MTLFLASLCRSKYGAIFCQYSNLRSLHTYQKSFLPVSLHWRECLLKRHNHIERSAAGRYCAGGHVLISDLELTNQTLLSEIEISKVWCGLQYNQQGCHDKFGKFYQRPIMNTRLVVVGSSTPIQEYENVLLIWLASKHLELPVVLFK